MSLAYDLAGALDPACYALAAGIEPDPWQERLLRSAAPRILINASRQSGKSTTTASLAAHTAVYRARSLTLLLSPTLRQSGELFKKVQGTLHAHPAPPAVQSETALTLTLKNGSRIVSLPGSEESVRGYSAVDLLIVDEASRVSDALYYSIRPMLAVSRGRLLALSTPFGTRGWWYEAWVSAQSWERYEVPARLCPRISAEFLAEERESMGDWWYRQEYGCEFIDAQSAAFARADIDRAFDSEVETWDLVLPAAS